MIRDYLLTLDASMMPQSVVPFVNLASGPFSLFLLILLLTYFQRHHRFHQLGIALIMAGFACRFFRQIGLMDPDTTLWVLSPIGIMVITVMALVKTVRMWVREYG